MAEIGGNIVNFFVIILAVLSLDVFCFVTSSTNPPINSFGGSSSTPWPELGAKKQYYNQGKVNQQSNNQNTQFANQNNQVINQNNQFTNQNSQLPNQNSQLSYTNPNLNQNRNVPQRLNSPNFAGGAHSGLALSYGPGQAVIVPQTKPQSSNQNTQNQNIQNKNQNLPNQNKSQNTQSNNNQNIQNNVNQNIQNKNQQNIPNKNTNTLQNQNQNVLQGVWSNSGKTQQVINNLTPSTSKPNLSTSIPPKPTQIPTSSTTGSFKSTEKQTVSTQKSVTTEKPTEKLTEDEELRQFFEQLIKKDSGTAAQHVTVNYQGKTTSRSMNDEAPQPLLDIRPAAYQIPSISKLLALHNNYILETNINEHITPQERLEENDLLDSIVNTPVMQAARNFLIQKGIVSKDPKDFRDKLKEIWFSMYSRGGGRIGSSGFEHVFLAEIKNDDVTGLHNWLYFKDAEMKGKANYLGYMRKIDLGNKGAILKHHFTFNGHDKPVGSMFIGTSPELEIALYSTCFLLKPDQVCPMRFDGKNFIVRTYTFRYRGKNMIGSAFPEI